MQEKEKAKENEEGEGETEKDVEDRKKEGDTHAIEDVGLAVPKLQRGIAYAIRLSKEEKDLLGSPSPEPHGEWDQHRGTHAGDHPCPL